MDLEIVNRRINIAHSPLSTCPENGKLAIVPKVQEADKLVWSGSVQTGNNLDLPPETSLVLM